MAVAPEAPDLLNRALDIFGDALTAAMLTGGHRRSSQKERDLSLRSDVSRNILAAAVEIAEDLLELEAKSTVQAWFVGKNEWLGDRAPALVIATDPDAVRAAAKHFAVYG